MPQTSYERFHRMFKMNRCMARICGADIIDPNYKMSPVTWTVIAAINLFFAFSFYTAYNGLVVEGDWKIVLQTLCLVGSGIQGFSKLVSCIRAHKIISQKTAFLYSIYKEYEQKGVAYEKPLKNSSDLTWKMFKIVLFVYVFAESTMIFYPLFYWLLHGEKMLVMQFVIPGLDPTTSFGYITYMFCQVCLMCIGGFGNFAGDIFIFIFIINIPLLKDILQVKFQKLNEVILETHDPKITMPLLKEIIEWHQICNKYTLHIEEAFYGVIFAQIASDVVSICCTIFSMLIGSWPAAFAYLFYSYFSMYAYCSLGHLVEISNDAITTTIYTDCLWYELTVPEQKLVLLMLRKSQKAITLSIGQVMPCSMSSALQLTKCIYSYMMMLLNFLATDRN